MNKTTILAALMLTTAPAAAFAHATFLVGEAPVESYYLAVLQVPHGCGDKATTEVQLKLPEGFVFAKPMPKAGWEVEIIRGKYQKAYDNHGEKITEGPVEIRWKNGHLPDEFYDTFTVQGKFSGLPAGTVVAFPATQLCGTDGKVAWDEIAHHGQDAHALKHPAPTVILVASNDHQDHHGHQAAGDFAAVTVGEIEVSKAAVKAMTPGQPVAGGFFTLTNHGKHDDRLVAVTTDARVDHVEIHEMKMEGDVMRMRQLPDGLAVPAGATVELKPGGLHLMFMGVAKPFTAGESVKAVLEFEKAGKVEIVMPVKEIKAGHH
jgi:uncharacterized protein YcnI/copper(I)-binding protein